MSFNINQETLIITFITIFSYFFYYFIWPIFKRGNDKQPDILSYSVKSTVDKNKNDILLFSSKINFLKYVIIAFVFMLNFSAYDKFTKGIVSKGRGGFGTVSGYEHFIMPLFFSVFLFLSIPMNLHSFSIIKKKLNKYFLLYVLSILATYLSFEFNLGRIALILSVLFNIILIANLLFKIKKYKISSNLKELGLDITKGGFFETREYIFRSQEFNIFIFPSAEPGISLKGGGTSIITGIRFALSEKHENDVVYPDSIQEILNSKNIKLFAGMKCWDIKGNYSDKKIYKEIKKLELHKYRTEFPHF